MGGRIADYLVAPDGRLVSGISLTDNFATQIPGALQVQLIQEVRTALRIRLVPGPDFGPDTETAIRNLMELRFGPDMGFTLETVDEIPPEPSGKYRFAICRLSSEDGVPS